MEGATEFFLRAVGYLQAHNLRRTQEPVKFIDLAILAGVARVTQGAGVPRGYAERGEAGVQSCTYSPVKETTGRLLRIR